MPTTAARYTASARHFIASRHSPRHDGRERRLRQDPRVTVPDRRSRRPPTSSASRLPGSTGRRRRTGELHPRRAVPLVPGIGVAAAVARIRLDFLERAAQRPAAGPTPATEKVSVADLVQGAVVVGGEDVLTGSRLHRWSKRCRGEQQQESEGETGYFLYRT